LCSAGDFYGGADVFNEPKSHFVAQMMGYLGYDAVGIGEMDLNYGLEKLVQDGEKYDINLTCANLISKSETEQPKKRQKKSLQQRLNTVFPPYKIVEADGVRFGFVALLSPQTKSHTAGVESGVIETINYVIEDPWKMAETVVPHVRDKCDVLVLLAHMDLFDLEMKLPEFSEFDLVILGHSTKSSRTEEPVTVGATPVYYATTQGQNIGNLKITLDNEVAIVDIHNKIHFLGEDVPDNPEVLAMLDEFDEQNRKTQKILFAKEQLKASRSSGEEEDIYLGVGSCISCHPDAFDVYVQSRHAHAYQTLASQFVHRDDNCIGCHVTGYGKRGGFSGLRRLGSPVDLIDVQCEACHGPGTEHSRDGRYGQAAVESCVRCHTEEEDPNFDYEEAWKKIAH
jgi:2',3'-cyclic-nucleotide 2'-phosphodiesterase (5'-nucleotidase family)